MPTQYSRLNVPFCHGPAAYCRAFKLMTLGSGGLFSSLLHKSLSTSIIVRIL